MSDSIIILIIIIIVLNITRVTKCYFTQPPMRRMRICFKDVFFLFSVFFCFFFRPSQKYQTTVLGNGWTDFPETFTKRSGENVVSNVVQKWGLGPKSFFGAKDYTLRTWWWRLVSDWELVCWLWHCSYGGCVKNHERANAFNLVLSDLGLPSFNRPTVMHSSVIVFRC